MNQPPNPNQLKWIEEKFGHLRPIIKANAQIVEPVEMNKQVYPSDSVSFCISSPYVLTLHTK